MRLRNLTYLVSALLIAGLFWMPKISYAYSSSITVGSDAGDAVAVGHYLYVSGELGTVSVVDMYTNTTVATITVAFGADPETLVGTDLYVVGNNAVSVIDTNTNTVTNTITVGDAAFAEYLVGTHLYVDNENDNTVSVIDTNTKSLIKTINVGIGPFYNVVDGTKMYVMDEGDPGTVSVIDTTTDTVVSTIDVGPYPVFASIVGTNLYVSYYGGGPISVIDTNTNTVSSTINTDCTGAAGSYLVGTNLYLLCADQILTINTQNNTVTTTVSSSGLTADVSILYQGKIYATNTGNNTVTIFDIKTNTVTATLSVGSGPYFLFGNGTNVYIMNDGDTVVSVINALTSTLLNVAAPVLVSFSSTSSNGTYRNGQSVNITANFGIALGTGSTMTVTLNSGASVTLNTISGTTLSGSYVVGSGDSTPDLNITGISSASVKDVSGSNVGTSYGVPLPPQLTGFLNSNLGGSSNISINNNYQTLSTGTNPYQIAVVGSVLYVANEGSNTVSVINSVTGSVIQTINVGVQPYGVVYDSSTKEIYVTNIDSNNVSVIDADPSSGTYNTVTHTISVGVQPFYIALIGNNIYVTNNLSNTVSVINTTSHTNTATIPVGTAPLGIKAVGTNLYVANSNSSSSYGGVLGDGTVSVIDSTNNTVSATIMVGLNPRGITISGTEVYVANFEDGTVSVIDSTNNTVTHTITVGSGSRGVLTVGTNVYVENFNDGTISVINTNNHTVTATVKVGGAPAGMAAIGTNIYLSRFTDSELSIFDTTNNTLEVLAAPSAPTGLSATAGDGQVTLSWTAPTSTNGSAITDYSVQYRPTGSSSWTTFTHSPSTSLTQTVTGLTDGTTYDFQVAAINSIGTGAYSSTTSATPITQTTSYSGGGSYSGGSSSGGSSGSTTPPPTTPPTTPPSTPTQPTTPTGGNTSPTSQPNTQGSTLVNDHGTFYLISGTSKYGITNPGILKSYGYTFAEASAATPDQSALAITSNLSPNNGALVKTSADPTVYLISNGQRYGFTSSSVFITLGYKFTSVVVVTTPELNQLTIANPLSNTTQAHLPGANIISKGTIYWIGPDNQLHAYPSLAIYNSWNIPNNFSTVVPANQADLTLPIGSADVMRV